MIKNQEDKLGTYDAILNQNKLDAKATEGKTALSNSYTALGTVVAAIYSTEQQYRIATKGNSDGKVESREDISEFTYMVAGAVLAWATDQKDTVLMAKVKTTKSALSRTRDEKLTVTCEWYNDFIKTNQAQLTEYGLTKEVVVAYGLAVESYKVAVPATRNGMTMRKAHKEKLIELFKEADKILKFKIDMLILPLKKTNPEYYSAYRGNRKVVNSAKRRTAFRITVRDKETGNVVEGATISIEAIGFEGISDKDGLVMAKPVPLGSYTVVVKKDGYVTKTLGELKTTLGKTNRFDILLEKAG
jgi:uncharacterized protein (DUF486 family)